MQRKIKCEDPTEDVYVMTTATDILIFQSADMVMLFDARMARQTIRALRKAVKELGWEDKG